MNSLIEGAVDLHVHSGPDIIGRKIDDVDLAQRIEACGMDGYVIKSHYFCTAERAANARRTCQRCNVMGSVCLNNAVGGLNASAAYLAVKSGAVIIWFPTSDAAHELKELFQGDGTLPPKIPLWGAVAVEMRQKNVPCDPLCILNKDGLLKAEAHRILEIAANAKVAVATGHLSHKETFALSRAARDQGIKKLIVTHATYPSTFYTIDEQRELVGLGAFIEHCFTTYSTGKVTFDVIAEQIRAIGPEHVVISTDLGQPKNVFPDEGMLRFSLDLLAAGFTRDEIRRMNNLNPHMLCGQ